MNKPFAVTLFSGLGSSSKALRDLGYDVIPHDFMAESVATLIANGFTRATWANVRDIDYSGYPEVEVLVGGPPCQPFSQSANNDGQYDDRDMIPEFVRAVAELTPSLFVMEEVQTLTWKKHAAYLERVESDLRAIGYRVEHRVLNAAHYGHGQARKRLFVVGVREDVAQGRDEFVALYPGSEDEFDAIVWPESDHYIPITMAQALGWSLSDAMQRAEAAPVYGSPRADGMPSWYWVFERASTTVVGTFRPEVQAAPGYRKAGDGPRQNAAGSVVTTLEERLILQDMPADWVVKGSKSKRDLQVGNSVPCGLIRDLIDINIP